MKFYRGYFGLAGKQPLMRWKRELVSDESLLTIEQADGHTDYGAPLTEHTALIDIDDGVQADKLYELVRNEGIKCRVIATDRGKHFLFDNKDKILTKCQTHVRFAVGLSGDIKVGWTNSYEKLKSHGKVRQCIYGQDLTDTDQLDPVPEWLKVIGKEADTLNYPAMGEGSGRNDALYQLSCNLQRRGFSKEAVITTCHYCNDYVFDEPLEESELRLVTRDESLQVKPIFGDLDEEAKGLADQLEYDGNGKLKPTLKNAVSLIKMAPELRSIRKNLLSGSIDCDQTLPWARNPMSFTWTDEDDAALRMWFETYYSNLSSKKIIDALTIAAEDRAYHPVREYLEGLPAWDGVKRVDELLIDFLGADDTEYVRAVTRKTLCAAIKRAYEPGCKHDTMLVLNGKQGIGKSTLIRRLGMKWFTDTLTLGDMAGKEGIEKIQGQWIVEIGELAGMKKVEIEMMRSYLSRLDDYGRKAYGRNAEHRPRQCIFFGTTNAQEDGFLRDVQGNRRFWVVDLPDEGGLRSCIGPDNDLEQWEIDQIWAEARRYYLDGEDLVLTGKLAEEAAKIQDMALEEDPREGIVQEYLDRLLPEDWYDKSVSDRVRYLAYPPAEDAPNTMQRTRVCNMEIWKEALEAKGQMTKADSYALAALMRRIGGWEKGKKVTKIKGYGTVRYYYRVK